MKVNKNPSPAEVRRFVGLGTAASALMGGLLFWRHHPAGARGVWIASAAVGFCGLLIPPLARRFYGAWMALAEGIHFAVTRVLLIAIFFLVLTPMALVGRLLRRDMLGLRKTSFPDSSYWKEHDRMADLSYYKHLY